MNNLYRNEACPACRGAGFVAGRPCACDGGVTPTLWAVKLTYFEKKKDSVGMNRLADAIYIGLTSQVRAFERWCELYG